MFNRNLQPLLWVHNRLKCQTGGFTLVELLVVMIIVGILAAVALPNLISQVGKAKEAEVLINLGALARAQKAYHYVNGQFALNFSRIQADSGAIASKYYDLDNITGDANMVKIQAIPLDAGRDQVRNFAIGVYFINGAYGRATCRGARVGEDVQVGDTPDDPCTNNGFKLR